MRFPQRGSRFTTAWAPAYCPEPSGDGPAGFTRDRVGTTREEAGGAPRAYGLAMILRAHSSRAVTAALAAAFVACAHGQTQPGGDASAPPPSASAPAPSSSASDVDKVRPDYPLDASTPDPLAVRLCTALHEVPARRRAECCSSTPGVLVTSECVRMLSTALHFAAVSVDPSRVDACVQAIERTYAGCDWVGPNVPQPPEECSGLVVGQLPSGDRCRSSLECAPGLRCQGVGPTDVGRCGEPRDDGASCGGTVDPLAVYSRDNHFDAKHPECKGWCDRRKCTPPLAKGSRCSPQTKCAEGLQCVRGTCDTPQLIRTEGPKAAGEACKTDLECRGGCLKPDGGAQGQCGMKCQG